MDRWVVFCIGADKPGYEEVDSTGRKCLCLQRRRQEKNSIKGPVSNTENLQVKCLPLSGGSERPYNNYNIPNCQLFIGGVQGPPLSCDPCTEASGSPPGAMNNTAFFPVERGEDVSEPTMTCIPQVSTPSSCFSLSSAPSICQSQIQQTTQGPFPRGSISRRSPPTLSVLFGGRERASGWMD